MPFSIQGSKTPLRRTLAVNAEKFKEPVSPVMPEVLSSWVSAQAGVHQNEVHQVDHRDRHLLRGYPVPDPYLLAKPTDELANTWRLMVAWLYIRQTWLADIISNEKFAAGYPKSQHWRQGLLEVMVVNGVGRGSRRDVGHESSAPGLFGMGKDVGQAAGVSSLAASLLSTHTGQKRRQEVVSTDVLAGAPSKKKRSLKTKQEVGDMFNFSLKVPPDGSPGDVFWQGVVVIKAAEVKAGSFGFTIPIARQIMWDIFENNFRLELLTLDRAIVPRSSDGYRALERDGMVMRVMPTGAFMTNRMPYGDMGLGARSWQNRARFVEAFRELLSSWPGEAAQQLKRMSAGVWVSDGVGFQGTEWNVLAVERIALPFYCQMFFNYFGRAATIPHIRP